MELRRMYLRLNSLTLIVDINLIYVNVHYER
jgi:hypothetical protein